MYVCFIYLDKTQGFQTYIHAQGPPKVWFWNQFESVCLSVYVSFSMTGRGIWNIHTCLNASEKLSKIWNSKKFKRVCMFDFHDRLRVFEQVLTFFVHIIIRRFLFEANFHDRLRVFKHTYMLKSLLDAPKVWFLMKFESVCLSVDVSFPWQAEGFETYIQT